MYTRIYDLKYTKHETHFMSNAHIVSFKFLM
jgi:hypothetical protein